jgi:outer membrane protein assembly factor BamB
MATLEVHDGTGRVERKVIARDEPVMFGSSPKCDIVLAGEGILPFHGRVRWQTKKGRFKVDASPDAEFLWVNGHKMASSSFRQGDEVQVGPCRIYMINEGEAGPVALKSAPPRDDVTRIQPSPFIAPPAPGTVIARGSWRAGREAEVAPAPAPVEVQTDFEEVERELRKKRTRRPEPAAPSTAEPPRSGWERFVYLFSARAYAPGREEVLSSPLVFGLGVTLAVLILVGFALYNIIAQSTATRLYTNGLENLEDGDYRTSIRQLDEFLRANPNDERAPKARVHRAMANVRQYTSAASASWTLALEAEKEMFDAVGGTDEFRDSSTELEELVIRTGEALADRARLSSDAKALVEADSALVLHKQVVGPAAEALLKKSQLPEKLAAARAAVKKAQVRKDRLAAMDRALKAGSTAGVYAARDALAAEYPDQAQDRELLARMNEANALIRKAVTVDESGRPGETEPHPEPLGPPTTLVLRQAPSIGSNPLETTPAKDGVLVFALSDGFAFAVDGSTGTPVWQVSVGLSSPFPPQPIPGGRSVLAIDARHGELVQLDARTGALNWRQSLGDRVTDPPLVLGNQVIQATTSGKLLVLDLLSGALRATMNLGMPLARTPVADESGQALYIAAEKDVLFVLTRDPLGCAAVEYLGHPLGSIGAAPARIGRYLILPENHEINESRWRAFVLAEDGLKLTPVQQVPVLGWTWSTPASSGSVVWASGDRGGVAAFAVGAYGEPDPFRLIARIPPDEQPSGPAFALARSERELWIGSGRSGRFELDPEGGRVNTSWTLAGAGPAAAPPQIAGALLILTQQNTGGPGVALWGVEPATGTVRWRTILGAAWPSPPEPEAKSDRLIALGVDGRPIVLTHQHLVQGGFVTSTLPTPGSFRLPAGAAARVEGDSWTAIFPALRLSKILVRSGTGAFQEVSLPAPIGARPLAWGRELLVPGEDGRAYLIDPSSGESRAEPFVPPFDRTRPTRWRSPVALAGDAVALADDTGRVRRLVRLTDPRPRLSVSAEIVLGKGLLVDPASTGGAVVLVTDEDRVRALSARDLSAVGSWPLEAPLAAPPAATSGYCFLADTSGAVLALGPDGQRLWSTRLESKGHRVVVAGAPAVHGKSVWFLSREGGLFGRSTDDGSPLAEAALDIPPAAGPVSAGQDLAVPVGLGTIRLLTLDGQETTPRPAKAGESKER